MSKTARENPSMSTSETMSMLFSQLSMRTS